MPIALAPAMNVAAIGQAANVAGQEDRRRYDEQQGLRTRQVDLQEAEMRQREKLTYADMAFKEAMQQQNYAEAGKARQFGLDAQKEILALQHGENQKAREFDFGARRYLQDDQQQFGAQQQELSMRFQDYWKGQDLAAQQWSQMAQQAAREREQAMQLAAQRQRDVFGHMSDMQRLGYSSQLQGGLADAAHQRRLEMLPLETQQSLAQYGGQLDLQQQQQQAKIQQQLALIDQAERAGQIDAATAQQMRMQVQLQGSGATVPRQPTDYLPIMDPTTGQPLTDPGTGLPLLRDPITGEPVRLPVTAPQAPKPPPDNTKLIADIAQQIMATAPPGTKSYQEAWAEAQQLINGGGSAPSPMPFGSGLPPAAPLGGGFNDPTGSTSSGDPSAFNMPFGGGGTPNFNLPPASSGSPAPQPVPTDPSRLVVGQVYGPVSLNGGMWYVRWTGQAFEGVQQVQ